MKSSPLPSSFRASPYPPLASSAEADWLAHFLHEIRALLLTITVQAFVRCRTTMPSADFCGAVNCLTAVSVVNPRHATDLPR